MLDAPVVMASRWIARGGRAAHAEPRRDRRAHFGGFGSSWPAKDPKDRRYRRKPPATNPKNTPSRAFLRTDWRARHGRPGARVSEERAITRA